MVYYIIRPATNYHGMAITFLILAIRIVKKYLLQENQIIQVKVSTIKHLDWIPLLSSNLYCPFPSNILDFPFLRFSEVDSIGLYVVSIVATLARVVDRSPA